MLLNLSWFDTSNFPSDHVCCSKENEKKMGTFKDETSGIPIIEFCGLRSDLYAYRTEHTEDLRVKGIQKYVRNKTINFDHYLEV